jgi:hypothetical protein
MTHWKSRSNHNDLPTVKCGSFVVCDLISVLHGLLMVVQCV